MRVRGRVRVRVKVKVKHDVKWAEHLRVWDGGSVRVKVKVKHDAKCAEHLCERRGNQLDIRDCRPGPGTLCRVGVARLAPV